MADRAQWDDPPSCPWLPWFVALDDPRMMRKGWRTVGNNRRWTNPSSAKAKHWTWERTRFDSADSESWQMIKRMKMTRTADSKEAENGGHATVVRWGPNTYSTETVAGQDDDSEDGDKVSQ